jgi:hypothetical protein
MRKDRARHASHVYVFARDFLRSTPRQQQEREHEGTFHPLSSSESQRRLALPTPGSRLTPAWST